MITHKRNAGIDIIRGCCILAVILLHCSIHIPLDHPVFSKSVSNLIFRSGYYAVIIFFVVSGFLITSISLHRWGKLESISLRHFYQMRFARIMPCLLLLLIVLSFLDRLGIPAFLIHTTSLGEAVFSALTFHLNYLEAKTGYLPGNWDLLWSLSIEEMYYLFFPIFCVMIKNPKYLWGILLLFIISGPFARTVWTHNDIWADHSYLSCMDGIAFGCMAGWINFYLKFNRGALKFFLFIGILIFSFVFFFRKTTYALGITPIGLNVTLLELSMALILIGLQQASQKIKKEKRSLLETLFLPIRWFGKNSYEIYLTHFFVILLISKYLFLKHQAPIQTGLDYFFVIVLSGIAGELMMIYFSQPLNALIRKLA